MSAHDFEVDGIFYNISGDEAVVTFKGNKYSEYDNEYSGSVVIPEKVTYDGQVYNVTSIGRDAFFSCSGLTDITIPNSVTSIGRDAFIGTTWYNNLPDGIVYAGKVLYSYKGTRPNGAININEGTLVIADKAFENCTGLTSVTIPNSVTSIGDNAFYKCKGLTSITIGNSVTSIGNYAFSDCSGLTAVHISDLAAWCNIDFASWSSNPLYFAKLLYLDGELVKDIVIPEGVENIKNHVFFGCSGLTSVTIPNSVTSIGESAFYYCI